MGGGNLGLFYIGFWLLRRPWGWAVLLVGGIVYFFMRSASTGDSRALHQNPDGTHALANEAPEVHFVSFVLDDVQSTWSSMLDQGGKPYRHAKLVPYTDVTRTGCGSGSASTGPFYCPTDERVYLDLGFFHELSSTLGARGHFAQAYVVAHELGHHIEKVLGTMDHESSASRGANGQSVRLELQADCYAGIWAHSAGQRNQLETGDIDSALSAAAAVGDDRLQRAATGTVRPESWTHGSSQERKRWFTRGYDSGRLESCDTSRATAL